MRKASGKGAWRNRIVRTGTEKAGQLLGNEMNWKIHPGAQQDAVRTLIGHDLGWLQTVLVNLRTAKVWGRDRRVETLLDGHLRAQLALQQGEDTPVPVTYVDLTPAEERLALLTLNPTAAMAVADDEKLDALLAEPLETELDVRALLGREAPPEAEISEEHAPPTRFSVLVECRDQGARDDLMAKLKQEGYRCRPMTS